MFATISSFAATAADYTDIVYAKNVKASLGGTVEVPIYLKNPSYAVKSLTFTIVLPDGITFDGYKTTKMTDFSEWNIDFATKTGESANTALAQMYYTKDASTTIASGDRKLGRFYASFEDASSKISESKKRPNFHYISTRVLSESNQNPIRTANSLMLIRTFKGSGKALTVRNACFGC